MLTYVLHHNEYEPVGALYEKKADVMFVATLNSSADNGRMLQPDFLHYLRNREICVPALRDCTDDIIPLAEFFLSLTDRDKYLSADAKSLLMRHQWPGLKGGSTARLPAGAPAALPHQPVRLGAKRFTRSEEPHV